MAVNCATKLVVVIFNTYTRFNTSTSDIVDVCNGLVFLDQEDKMSSKI